MNEKNAVVEKSFLFALRIMKLCDYLESKQIPQYKISQLYRSGTSVGANIAESQEAQSKSDFISKLSISLKEASETAYWLRLFHSVQYLSDAEYDSISAECHSLIKLLTTIINSTKRKSN